MSKNKNKHGKRKKKSINITNVKTEIIRESFYEDKNIVIKYPANMLMTKVKRDSPKFIKSFERLEKERISLLDKFYSITISHIDDGMRKSIKRKDRRKYDCSRLMYSAANTITASFELLRNGYILQSPALLRSIVETFCVVVAINDDLEIYKKFLDNKYDVNKSIGKGKSILPQIGRFQGMLSNNYVHINPLHLEDISLTSAEGMEESILLSMDLVINAIMILYLISELVFAEYNEEILFWKYNKDKDVEFSISSKGEKLLNEYKMKFRINELYNLD